MVIIRSVKLEDYKDISEIRRLSGVRESILGIISEREEKSKITLEKSTSNDHLLVAEVEENGIKKVVGLVGIHVSDNPRTRHTAGLGIMLHKGYQGMGIGNMLMKEILDLADNWLMLIRIELEVFTDNEKAIKMYKKHGFEIEGTKKYAAVKNGKYADEYIMARYKNI